MFFSRGQTLYELKSKVEPHKGTEFCRVGNMCSMLIEISKFGKKQVDDGNSQQPQNSLMYEVRARYGIFKTFLLKLFVFIN